MTKKKNLKLLVEIDQKIGVHGVQSSAGSELIYLMIQCSEVWWYITSQPQYRSDLIYNFCHERHIKFMYFHLPKNWTKSADLSEQIFSFLQCFPLIISELIQCEKYVSIGRFLECWFIYI